MSNFTYIKTKKMTHKQPKSISSESTVVPEEHSKKRVGVKNRHTPFMIYNRYFTIPITLDSL